jgi:hypothetical protein
MRFVSSTKSFTVPLGVENGATANEGIGGAGNHDDVGLQFSRERPRTG